MSKRSFKVEDAEVGRPGEEAENLSSILSVFPRPHLLHIFPEGCLRRLAITKLPSKKLIEIKKAIAHNPICVCKRNRNSCKYPTSSNHRISAMRREANSNNSHKPNTSVMTRKIRFILGLGIGDRERGSGIEHWEETC